MTETIIELRQPSSEGRLFFKPDSHLLLVESSQWRQMAYCVNIDGGSLLLYFDKQRKLRDIEFGIPRSHWKKLSVLTKPIEAKPADIFLRGVTSYHGKWKHPHIRRRSDNSTIRIYDYEHRVFTVTDMSFSAIHITLGTSNKLCQWFALSEDCQVSISENRLKGIFVNISG